MLVLQERLVVQESLTILGNIIRRRLMNLMSVAAWGSRRPGAPGSYRNAKPHGYGAPAWENVDERAGKALILSYEDKGK